VLCTVNRDHAELVLSHRVLLRREAPQYEHHKERAVLMTSAMQFGSLVFPTGTQVPGTSAATLQLSDGSPQTVSAQLTVDGYLFIFWDVNLHIYPTQYSGGIADLQQVVDFTAPSEESFYATSWYLAEGGDGGSGVTAWAFSLNDNKAVPNSPLASVSPAGAQEGPNTVSTTTSDQAVIITAPRVLTGYGLFSQWLQISGNGTVNGQTLTVPAGGASLAVAFYAIPQPDPCADLRAELANINCSDFPNFADCERVVRGIEAQLRQCEQQYGETP